MFYFWSFCGFMTNQKIYKREKRKVQKKRIKKILSLAKKVVSVYYFFLNLPIKLDGIVVP